MGLFISGIAVGAGFVTGVYHADCCFVLSVRVADDDPSVFSFAADVFLFHYGFNLRCVFDSVNIYFKLFLIYFYPRKKANKGIHLTPYRFASGGR
jgi:hypothetical protein